MPSKQSIQAATDLVGDYQPRGSEEQELYAQLRVEFLTAVACLTLDSRSYATTALGLAIRYALFLERNRMWDRHDGQPVPYTHRWVTLFTDDRVQQGYRGAQTGQSLLSAIGRLYQPSLWPRPTSTARDRDPQEPYSTKEQNSYRAVASQYRAAYGDARIDATVAAGFGAGLAVADFRVVRGCHVWADADNTALVRVDRPSQHGRVVPVLPSWSQLLLDAAAQMGDQLLVSGADDATRNLTERITVPLRKFSGMPLSFSRMRSTWLVGRLAAGVPERVVREFAGLQDSARFSQFDQHYSTWDNNTRRAWIRNGGSPC